MRFSVEAKILSLIHLRCQKYFKCDQITTGIVARCVVYHWIFAFLFIFGCLRFFFTFGLLISQKACICDTEAQLLGGRDQIPSQFSFRQKLMSHGYFNLQWQ